MLSDKFVNKVFAIQVCNLHWFQCSQIDEFAMVKYTKYKTTPLLSVK